MKMKSVFLMTHLGSGAKYLTESLNQIPTISCIKTNKLYSHPTDLVLNKYFKTVIDTLEFNHLFTCKALYSQPFIYFINRLQDVEGYSHTSLLSYYLFRLRRLYEMASQTPNSIFLTYDDLLTADGQKLLVDFLELKEPLEIKFSESPEWTWHSEDLNKGYEKYLEKFRNLDLRQINRA
ncbi:MAG TPA: hypothetical protein VK809_08000 [Bacteroidia bacterium]|nr:hypothetical protein [Bacteroidia bacterium]